jgi:hypothetical protein
MVVSPNISDDTHRRLRVGKFRMPKYLAYAFHLHTVGNKQKKSEAQSLSAIDVVESQIHRQNSGALRILNKIIIEDDAERIRFDSLPNRESRVKDPPESDIRLCVTLGLWDRVRMAKPGQCDCYTPLCVHANKQNRGITSKPIVRTYFREHTPHSWTCNLQRRVRNGESRIWCCALENLLRVQQPRFSSQLHHDSGSSAASRTNKSREPPNCKSS